MTKFDDLIADPFTRRVYATIIEPYSKISASTTTLYLADDALVTGPTDAPAHQYFEPRLINALNFERHLVSPGQLGGRSSPGFGTLDITNADGALDDWRDLAFDGRRVRVLLGGPDFALSDFGLIFDGTAEGIEFDDDVIRVALRDQQSFFEKPIQETTYLGTGGLEGGEALEGKPKPVTFGRVHRIEPVPVDPANLVYQVHDGPISGVVAVYDKGVPLTKVAAPPGPGQFSEDTTAGTLTLGTSPAGVVTADVDGDANGGYVSTVATVIRRIVTTRGGLADPEDLAVDSFAALDAANAAIVGIHARDEIALQAILDGLADSIGAHYGFDRAGLFRVGRIEAPSPIAVATYSEQEIIEISRRPTARPIWRQRIGYKPYGTTLSGTDSAAALSDLVRADISEPYRVVEEQDDAIKTVHPLAGDDRRDTLLSDVAAARAEAARRLALFKEDRDVFAVKVKTQPFAIELGDTIEITYPRHGLSAGRRFVVIGMAEESAVNEVTLELWG